MKKLNTLTKKEEFDLIFEEYLFPLIGVPFGNSSFGHRERTTKNGLVEFDEKESKLYVYEDRNGNACYSISVNQFFPRSCISLLNTVLNYLDGSRYFNPSRKSKISTYTHLLNEFTFQTQRAVIDWLCDGSDKSDNIEHLINILEIWKNKTYEGKSVNFAFTIKLDDVVNKNAMLEFDEFLLEEYSATFTDGITSIVELDSNLFFLGYKSITSLENRKIDYSVGPLRFADVLNNFVDNQIGVMLLAGGDIVLIKNKEIKLVKREGKWLNFSKDVFVACISALLGKEDDSFKKLSEEIYLSALDVSFAHSGGIIAYVSKDNEELLTEPDLYKEYVKKGLEVPDNASTVLHFLDNLLTKIPSYDELISLNKSFFDNVDSRKRIRKRLFIQRVTHNDKFYELDRRLRTELISMDGATIIRENGNLLAVGAIIQNDSGSYGGGRGAAAKKLSKYGFAIKISTDGYIECYKGGRKVFKIK